MGAGLQAGALLDWVIGRSGDNFSLRPEMMRARCRSHAEITIAPL